MYVPHTNLNAWSNFYKLDTHVSYGPGANTVRIGTISITRDGGCLECNIPIQAKTADISAEEIFYWANKIYSIFLELVYKFNLLRQVRGTAIGMRVEGRYIKI